MNFLNIFLTGFALSMDAFAVSVTKGITLKNINSKIAFKIAFSFGFFQGVMPLIGWFLGIRFESYIKSIDHWIAFFLLGFIGLKMIFEALESNKIDFKNEAKKHLYAKYSNYKQQRNPCIINSYKYRCSCSRRKFCIFKYFNLSRLL